MRQFLNYLVILGSVFLCLLLLPLRLPGMELLGIAPHWTIIWLVSWSVKRTVFEGAIAGLILGMLQDSLTGNSPTHIIPLLVVGVLTAQLQKERYLREDFISIALIVFVMVIIGETLTMIQYCWQGIRSWELIWTHYQQTTLTSAILSSMWAPVVYYPLNIWWQQIRNN
jgi:rod shape-determining protein MreD